MSHKRREEHCDPPKVVHVIISPSHAALMDPPIDILRPYLIYPRKRFELGGKTGVREIDDSERAHCFDFRGRLAIPAGLLPRFRHILRAEGYQVRIDDWRHPTPLEVSPQFMLPATEPGRSLEMAMQQDLLGQIEVRNSKHALDTLVDIAAYFGSAQIAIAVGTKRHAWKIWRTLQRELREDVGLCLGSVHRRGD